MSAPRRELARCPFIAEICWHRASGSGSVGSRLAGGEAAAAQPVCERAEPCSDIPGRARARRRRWAWATLSGAAGASVGDELPTWKTTVTGTSCAVW
jgi:hypothetical protein